jgi:hypothetical protein
VDQTNYGATLLAIVFAIILAVDVVWIVKNMGGKGERHAVINQV